MGPVLALRPFMSRSLSLPTLFGRATAVLGEHPTFDRTIHRLRELCDVLGDEAAPPISERCRLMDELLSRMHAHFAAEETDYFATLISACPSVAANVNELSREHREFMTDAQWLRAAFDRDVPITEIQPKLASFIERFIKHEQTETLLLQEFLTRAECECD